MCCLLSALVVTACGGSTEPVVTPLEAAPDDRRVADGPLADSRVAEPIGAALALPVSTSTAVQSAALTLVVGPDELVLDPDPLGLALSGDGRLDPEVVSSRGRVPKLQTELTIQVDTRERMARDMKLGGPALSLAVVADASLPGATLRTLAATARDAGLETLELAVRPSLDAERDDDQVLALPLGAPNDGARAVSVMLDRDRAEVDGEPVAELSPMTLYNAVLAARAADPDHSERQSQATRLELVLGDEVALQTVVDALDGLRHRRLPADRATTGNALLDDDAPFADPAAFDAAVVVTDLAGQPVTLFDEVVLRVD